MSVRTMRRVVSSLLPPPRFSTRAVLLSATLCPSPSLHQTQTLQCSARHFTTTQNNDDHATGSQSRGSQSHGTLQWESEEIAAASVTFFLFAAVFGAATALCPSSSSSSSTCGSLSSSTRSSSSDECMEDASVQVNSDEDGAPQRRRHKSEYEPTVDILARCERWGFDPSSSSSSSSSSAGETAAGEIGTTVVAKADPGKNVRDGTNLPEGKANIDTNKALENKHIAVETNNSSSTKKAADEKIAGAVPKKEETTKKESKKCVSHIDVSPAAVRDAAATVWADDLGVEEGTALWDSIVLLYCRGVLKSDPDLRRVHFRRLANPKLGYLDTDGIPTPMPRPEPTPPKTDKNTPAKPNKPVNNAAKSNNNAANNAASAKPTVASSGNARSTKDATTSAFLDLPAELVKENKTRVDLYEKAQKRALQYMKAVEAEVSARREFKATISIRSPTAISSGNKIRSTVSASTDKDQSTTNAVSSTSSSPSSSSSSSGPSASSSASPGQPGVLGDDGLIATHHGFSLVPCVLPEDTQSFDEFVQKVPQWDDPSKSFVWFRDAPSELRQPVVQLRQEGGVCFVFAAAMVKYYVEKRFFLLAQQTAAKSKSEESKSGLVLIPSESTGAMSPSSSASTATLTPAATEIQHKKYAATPSDVLESIKEPPASTSANSASGLNSADSTMSMLDGFDQASSCSLAKHPLRYMTAERLYKYIFVKAGDSSTATTREVLPKNAKLSSFAAVTLPAKDSMEELMEYVLPMLGHRQDKLPDRILSDSISVNQPSTLKSTSPQSSASVTLPTQQHQSTSESDIDLPSASPALLNEVSTSPPVTLEDVKLGLCDRIAETIESKLKTNGPALMSCALTKEFKKRDNVSFRGDASGAPKDGRHAMIIVGVRWSTEEEEMEKEAVIAAAAKAAAEKKQRKETDEKNRLRNIAKREAAAAAAAKAATTNSGNENNKVLVENEQKSNVDVASSSGMTPLPVKQAEKKNATQSTEAKPTQPGVLIPETAASPNKTGAAPIIVSNASSPPPTTADTNTNEVELVSPRRPRRRCYLLLQNWWRRKQFAEVEMEWLVGRSPTVSFVDVRAE